MVKPRPDLKVFTGSLVSEKESPYPPARKLAIQKMVAVISDKRGRVLLRHKVKETNHYLWLPGSYYPRQKGLRTVPALFSALLTEEIGAPVKITSATGVANIKKNFKIMSYKGTIASDVTPRSLAQKGYFWVELAKIESAVALEAVCIGPRTFSLSATTAQFIIDAVRTPANVTWLG